MELRNNILPRDADACRDLADYFEAQARALRDHARGLETAELFDWRKTIKVWRSGKFARALCANGMPETLAITTTARRLLVEESTVSAQMRFQQTQARKRAEARRNAEARRLASEGLSVREIGGRLRLSKSRIQQIIRDG
ncbi:MAG: hypothetical protein ACFB13_21165 [Kiloniellaceae bacterium]